MRLSGGCSQNAPVTTTRQLSRRGRSSARGGGEIVAQHRRMLLDRQHHAGAQHQIGFRRRGLPRLFRAEGIELANQPPIFVVERDREAQLVVGDRLAAQFAEVVPQLGQFVDVVIAADVVAIVLRHVEIANVDVRKHHLPHARQIADHVADRRKQHAVDEIEPARHAELHRGTRNAANIALVIGVAVDDFELIAAAENAERQHVGGVDELARYVDAACSRSPCGRASPPSTRAQQRTTNPRTAQWRERRFRSWPDLFSDASIVPSSWP